jgi:hypothetical protein
MTTASAKSTSGRVEWLLIDGCLREIGPDSPAFTLSAENTFILLKLLLQGKQEILHAVQKERIVSQQDMLLINPQQDGVGQSTNIVEPSVPVGQSANADTLIVDQTGTPLEHP